ncbi:cholecystokinin receptor type A [Elysia marginata]|uniref:Cholecystokinin receptor type A n=1 Tax=Elysia marginata TaxID=1093978 RepID=A0AAV4F191_9GAST|nr:cholecystokinin receptor type A [Elysia marginata]
MCKLYYFFENFCFCSSVLLLAAIAVERYIAVMHPLRVRGMFTTRRMHVAQVIIWVTAALYNIPLIIEFDTHTYSMGTNNTFTICLYNPDSFHSRAFYTTNLVLWYILPLVTMSATYAAISWTLWGATEKLASSGGSSSTLGSVVTLQKGGNGFVTQAAGSGPRGYDFQDGRGAAADGRGFRGERSSGGVSSDSNHSSSSVFRNEASASPDKSCCYSYRRFLPNSSNNNSHHVDEYQSMGDERSVESTGVKGLQALNTTEICMCTLCRSGASKRKFPCQPADARGRRLPVCWSWASIPTQNWPELNPPNSRAAASNKSDDGQCSLLEMVRLRRSCNTSQLQKSPAEHHRMLLAHSVNQNSLGVTKGIASPKPRLSSRSSEHSEIGQYNKDSCCGTGLKRKLSLNRFQRSRSLPSPSQRVLASRRRVVRLLVVVLVTFAACLLPHHIRLVTYSWNINLGASVGSGFLAPVAFVLLYLNSALNPVLYSVLSESFRRGVYECLRSCKKKSHLNLRRRRKNRRGCWNGVNSSYRNSMPMRSTQRSQD